MWCVPWFSSSGALQEKSTQLDLAKNCMVPLGSSIHHIPVLPTLLVTSPVLPAQLGLVYCKEHGGQRAVLPQVTREMGDSYLCSFY